MILILLAAALFRGPKRVGVLTLKAANSALSNYGWTEKLHH
jgi:hypothetical protein